MKITKRSLLTGAASAAALRSAKANRAIFQDASNLATWKDLQIGGAGANIWLDINPTDGTFLTSGDVFGPWISTVTNAGGNGNWITPWRAATVPSLPGPRTFWTGAIMKSSSHNPNTIVAFTNSNLAGGGKSVVISRDHGATWSIITGITPRFAIPDHAFGGYGQILFNPADDSEFYIGIPGMSGASVANNGLWHCTNWGGTCVQIDGTTNKPPSCVSGVYTGMAWRGNTVIIPSPGNGVYISTDGGSTFSASSGAPTLVSFGQFDSGGTYYCRDAGGQASGGSGTANVWRLNSALTTWTSIRPAGGWCQAIAVDPTTTGRVAVFQQDAGHNFNGDFDYSANADGAHNWAGLNTARTMTTGDTPWMSWSFNKHFGQLTLNFAQFDSSGRLWMACGIGICYATSVPTDGRSTITWIPMSQGLEGMEMNFARWMPTGQVLLAGWDRPLWVITDKTHTQSRYAPDNSTAIRYSESVDFAQDGSGFMAGQVANSLFYSSNGIGNWTRVGSSPLGQESCAMAVFTSQKWIVVDTYNNVGVDATCGTLYYTANGGKNWSQSADLAAGDFKCEAYHGGFNGSGAAIVCWDGDTVGSLGVGYVVNSSGTVFKTTNYGVNWSRVSSIGALARPVPGTRLRSVPGKAGHLFYTIGNPGTANPNSGGPTTNYMMFSHDGGANWTAVNNATYPMTTIMDVGFTAAAPGQSYPTVGVFGWVKGPGTGRAYTLDFWRCDNFSGTSTMTGNVWTQMNWAYVGMVSSVAGNPSTYNQWVVTCNWGDSAMGATYYA